MVSLLITSLGRLFHNGIAAGKKLYLYLEIYNVRNLHQASKLYLVAMHLQILRINVVVVYIINFVHENQFYFVQQYT